MCLQWNELQIVAFIQKLLGLGFVGDDIGVIAPYRLQVKLLRKHVEDHRYPIMVGSVEEFQGLERKIILISTVRTDVEEVEVDISRKMGIVADPKRTNVAISRAQYVPIKTKVQIYMWMI